MWVRVLTRKQGPLALPEAPDLGATEAAPGCDRCYFVKSCDMVAPMTVLVKPGL